MTQFVPNSYPDFDTDSSGMHVAFRDRGGSHHGLVTYQTGPGGGVTLSSEASAAIENSYPVKNAATQTTPQAWERLQTASGAAAAGISVRVNGNRYEFRGVIYGTFTIDTIIANLFSGYEEAVDSTAV